MNTYLLQIEPTSAADLRWQYSFSMVSDTMALDYATRVARADRVALGRPLTLFRIGGPLGDNTPEAVLATFKPTQDVVVTRIDPQ